MISDFEYCSLIKESAYQLSITVSLFSTIPAGTLSVGKSVIAADTVVNLRKTENTFERKLFSLIDTVFLI
jgi:hypothetical protein